MVCMCNQLLMSAVTKTADVPGSPAWVMQDFGVRDHAIKQADSAFPVPGRRPIWQCTTSIINPCCRMLISPPALLRDEGHAAVLTTPLVQRLLHLWCDCQDCQVLQHPGASHTPRSRLPERMLCCCCIECRRFVELLKLLRTGTEAAADARASISAIHQQHLLPCTSHLGA